MVRICNGQVYDPANGVRGEVRDIVIEEGKIVNFYRAERDSSERVPQSNLELPDEEIIDASGCVIMPGGVEIHSHLAGPKVNSARIMCPEDHYDHFKAGDSVMRSGSGFTVPSTFLTGYLYTALGYTTAFEAAVPPLKARHALEELQDTPLLDTGFYTLMGNNYLLMKVLSEKDGQGRRERLRDLVAWFLRSTKGYAVKVVNPGGVESWKWSQGLMNLDSPVSPFGVTPRRILTELVGAIEDLKLPHPLHLHPNHLGEPGNVETTIETMRSLEGHRVHFTHLQFHSYGITKKGGLKSAAPEIAEYLNQHPGFTCDVGQVMFGPVTTMTADSPMQFRLHQLTGNKWGNADVEMETGSGVVPLIYRSSNLVNAIQWGIGLELLLLIKNPWQIFLTTDHPNAAPFTAYPEIIHLLMDRDYRRARMEELHPKVKRYTHLAELEREYTLDEIAVITRSGPAKALGLKNKGHLGVGADADLAIYKINEDRKEMFSRPRYVLKEGRVVVENGEIKESFKGRSLLINPEGGQLPLDLKDDFTKYYTVAFSNFPVQEDYIVRPEVIPCS